MCGIAGALDLGAGPGVLDTVDPMTACLYHRGPDEDGLYRDEHVALGSRRLSIVDIAGSTQPIANEDETVWVVFNGQIYNYVELRADLEKRHTFRTQGDTETLVHLYEEEGPDFIKKLRGMFVFAIWDTKQRSLLLGRDRFGKKPLYYTRACQADRFLFASEIKALLQHGQIETTLDHDRHLPVPLLRLRAAPAHGVPGDRGGAAGPLAPDRRRRQRRRSSGTGTCRPAGRSRAAARTRWSRSSAVFDESVRIRLRSDVPVGVFLSGGIDSGLVTASAARASAEPLQSFSIGFADQRFDERPLAQLVAEQYGTRHTEVLVDLNAEVRRPEDLLTRLVSMYDQPYADSSAIPSNAVAREARKHLKVVLNGDGGDEAFAGYRRYSAALLADWMTTTLGPVAPLAAQDGAGAAPATRPGRVRAAPDGGDGAAAARAVHPLERPLHGRGRRRPLPAGLPGRRPGAGPERGRRAGRAVPSAGASASRPP